MEFKKSVRSQANIASMRPFTPAPQNAAANRIRERYLHQLGLQRGGAPPAARRVVVVTGLPSLPEDRAADGAPAPRPTDGEGRTGPPGAARALAPHAALPPPLGDGGGPILPFAPWSKQAWSKSSPALLEHAGDDHGSVSSAGTSTTAESSLTCQTVGNALLSRDWGQHASTSQGGEESLASSTPMGVYFQCGHPSLLGSVPAVATAAANAAGCAAASSLAHALHGFTLDSDCEASVTSASPNVDGEDSHAPMDEDDDDPSLDDTASIGSRASAGHGPLPPASGRPRGPRKKIGRTQRLLDRAAAHEAVRRQRSDRSRGRRAELVHSQRGLDAPAATAASASGLASAMTAADGRPIDGPCALVHVQHGADGGGSSSGPHQGRAAGGEHASLATRASDPGRTPTASNCTDLRRLTEQLHDQLMGESSVPERCWYDLPAGVHVSSSALGLARQMPAPPMVAAAPLGFPPQLASYVPAPPPKLATVGTRLPPSSLNVGYMFSKPCLDAGSTRSLHHLNHQATIEDVMDVAMTLSKLGERTSGPVPRIR